MPVKRRTVLILLGVGSAMAFGLPLTAVVNTRSRWLIVFRAADRRYGVAVLNNNGRILTQIKLPDRAHDVAVASDRRSAVVLTRRPGILKRTQFVSKLRLLIKANEALCKGWSFHSVQG